MLCKLYEHPRIAIRIASCITCPVCGSVVSGALPPTDPSAEDMFCDRIICGIPPKTRHPTDLFGFIIYHIRSVFALSQDSASRYASSRLSSVFCQRFAYDAKFDAILLAFPSVDEVGRMTLVNGSNTVENANVKLTCALSRTISSIVLTVSSRVYFSFSAISKYAGMTSLFSQSSHGQITVCRYYV